jgi:diaminopimelate decarboxylase
VEIVTPQEICTVCQLAQSNGLIAPEDTSVIFLNFSIIRDRVERLRSLFPPGTLHAVAIKTNPLTTVLDFLGTLDVGLEAASLPEVLLARHAGLSSAQIVFDSPAKTTAEIDLLCRQFPGLRVNADSLAELARYPQAGCGLQLGFRVNPLINSDTVGYMNVGGPNSKFGEPISNRARIVDACLAWKDVDCLHLHIGSQISDFAPTISAIKSMVELAEEINARSPEQKIRFLNLGGGFPVNYFRDSSPWKLEDYVARLKSDCPVLFDDRYRLITEYGRYVHANAGWVVTDVEYVKAVGDGDNLVVHVGADMFLRECYNPGDWHHEIFLIDRAGCQKRGPEVACHIAGPLCFGGDFVRTSIPMTRAEPGDRVVIQDVGANTFSLWSRHCSRPFPKVITYQTPPEAAGPVEMKIAKQRETIESIIDFWS